MSDMRVPAVVLDKDYSRVSFLENAEEGRKYCASMYVEKRRWIGMGARSKCDLRTDVVVFYSYVLPAHRHKNQEGNTTIKRKMHFGQTQEQNGRTHTI